MKSKLEKALDSELASLEAGEVTITPSPLGDRGYGTIEEYKKMLKELANIRYKHKFNRSDEEDLYTKKLIAYYDSLSKEDQDSLNK